MPRRSISAHHAGKMPDGAGLDRHPCNYGLAGMESPSGVMLDRMFRQALHEHPSHGVPGR